MSTGKQSNGRNMTVVKSKSQTGLCIPLVFNLPYIGHTFKMDHHASYALGSNLFNFYSFPFVHSCPSPQSLGFSGFLFCLFFCLFVFLVVLLFRVFFKHKSAFNLSIYSRQCLQYCPAPSMITGKLMVRQLFSLTCSFFVLYNNALTTS